MADDIWNAAAASLRYTGSTAIAAALILTLCRRSAPLVMNMGVACPGDRVACGSPCRLR
jgi:hypothetical protein